MLRCVAGPRLVALAFAARAIPTVALLAVAVVVSGCIGGSTPYPPAITGDVDAGETRGTDGGARDAASLSDLGPSLDLGLDPGTLTDGGTAADGATADADLPDADVADADVADADVADADTIDADTMDADSPDADVADADAPDADR